MKEMTEAEKIQEKKNKKIGILLGLIIVLIVSISASYAYWVIVLKQNDTNIIKTACLKITLDSDDEALSLQSAFPISDFEGIQTKGYTFTVYNDCDKPIDYRIELDSLKLTDESKRLPSSSVAVLLDYGSNFIENNEIPTYADLVSVETTDDNLKDKKELASDTVLGKTTNTHTLRIWVHSSSTLEDESKDFKARISVAAGQGIEKEYTDESCFTFDEATGKITAYDEVCGGTNLVIPYKIGDVPVTIIGTGAFKEKGLESVEIPRSVEQIDKQSFYKNYSLQKLILKDGLVEIGRLAFSTDDPDNMSSLHNLLIPTTTTTIGYRTFAAAGLKRLVIPNNVTTLDYQTFAFNEIKELKIGSGLSSIPDSDVFYENDIEDLVIPGNVKIVGNGAFARNPLKSITIKDGVTTLGSYVFYESIHGGTVPNEIYIPSSVTKLSEFGTFKDIPASTKIYFDNCKENVENSDLSGGTQIYKTDGCN